MGPRTRLFSLASAVLALAVCGCGPGLGPAGPGPALVTPAGVPPTVPPTAATTSTLPALPAALLLASDFGSAYALSGSVLSETGPTPSVRLLDPMECRAGQPGPGGGSAALVLDQARQLYAAPRGHFDSMAVWRFRAAGATTALAEVREQLRRCAREELIDVDVPVVVRWTVLTTGVAGQESLVVRAETRRGGELFNVDFFVVVRQDPVVASVWLSDQRWTTDRLRALGTRVAARLCAVAAC
ncbi:MAG TPA: hypothetical protein VFM55_07185 [Micromonosporaceae bacterium]|nr:hypothetical protein [Micromonosporaceae bacterium]